MRDFKKLVETFDIEEKFTFTGNRSDIRKILPSCDIGFCAATGEVGYSLSILEYMSAGLITVVPANPSTALATEQGLNGYVYKEKDVDSAVQALLNAIAEGPDSPIRARAVNDVLDKYDIRFTNQRLIEILQTYFR